MKNLKQLEPMEGQCKLKNPKEYHPIHNGRLFIEDLFSRINKYFKTADKKIKEAIPKKESSVVTENIKSAQENLNNVKDIIEKIKRKLADALKDTFPLTEEYNDHHLLNAAFKRQDLLDLMKRPEFNHSHVFQLDKLMKTLGNQSKAPETKSPLHKGGRKTRKRRNIRVKSRRYY